ncbi:NADH-quinone oxidoreductase subunit G [Candidatus Nitrosoglobus terrae]|uniref:NADH-quinone oxidoreductase n=1 Tax=Candidatus Nitrosoglobus terrae TaxID=1630141 RepID=A0A1Q2SL02_9GAMM|nr:NADH-quinone oxidoreductase subunit NuoG [Candidatus Nitrosoglobus terrae]BAW79783.1 NADH-quinone oxidoreductase subunit G [Candidatus Nitrosoglobus terrae]
MINIEIDNIKLCVEPGKMVIQAADEADIYIPRFCYHKKLSVAANCRMCLVEVEKARKPLPACATPVIEGMKVFTNSPRAILAQKGVMEFLLINHPLDCPICDQGGECELQDLAMGYGNDISRFTERKRVIKHKNIGPLIQTDLTRCIHCTRCIRFGEEIAGIKELGATGRGEHMEIGTYIEHSLISEVSGNVIDLCPVGALTDKPFRYRARAWEMIGHPTISPHDCVGTNIELHVLYNEVMRVVPRDNESINETWIADRDRYSCLGLAHEDRLHRPMVKRDGTWHEVNWEEALEAATNGLRAVAEEAGSTKLGGLASPYATVEELYLFQKLLRGLHCNNIDHRLRRQDFRNQEIWPQELALSCAIEEIEQSDCILLIGANVHKEQPLLGIRFRKAALRGAALMFINPVDYLVRFPVAEKIITGHGMIHALAGISKGLAEYSGRELEGNWIHLLADIQPSEIEYAIANRLINASHGRLFLGGIADGHPDFSILRTLADLICQLSGCQLGFLPSGGNAIGAATAGALPHYGPGGSFIPVRGLHVQAMLEEQIRGYLLLAVEPELDCANPALAHKALQNADFVVSLTAFRSQIMLEYANVLLPIGVFAETSGTFINAEGCWQSFAAAIRPPADTRPAWKVLRVLGNLLQIPGFEYLSSEEVRDELHHKAETVSRPQKVNKWYPDSLNSHQDNSFLVRVAEAFVYGTDGLVRRSKALQESADSQLARQVYMNSIDVNRLGLSSAKFVEVNQGGEKIILPLVVDNTVAEGCLRLASGLEETAVLGASFTPVQVAAVGR